VQNKYRTEVRLWQEIVDFSEEGQNGEQRLRGGQPENERLYPFKLSTAPARRPEHSLRVLLGEPQQVIEAPKRAAISAAAITELMRLKVWN